MKDNIQSTRNGGWIWNIEILPHWTLYTHMGDSGTENGGQRTIKRGGIVSNVINHADGAGGVGFVAGGVTYGVG